MQFQFFMSPLIPTNQPTGSEPGAGPTEILRQMLEVQREQLALQKNMAAAHDMTSRWKAYLTRWQQDFPDLPETCKFALPILERSYGALINDLADNLKQNGSDALDNDFALGDFLDRYGMRLSQLGTILSLVAFVAEAGSSPQAGESSSQ